MFEVLTRKLVCILVCMRQLNIDVTAEFEQDLRLYMRVTGVKRKSEAIRLALRKAVERESGAKKDEFREWLGLGLKAPLRKKRKFTSENDLWS